MIVISCIHLLGLAEVYLSGFRNLSVFISVHCCTETQNLEDLIN